MYDPTIPLPRSSEPPPGQDTPRAHMQRWLDHVRAGRIGSGPGTTKTQLARHVRNELAVLGRIY